MRATLALFQQDPARMALVRSVLSALAVGFLFRMVPDISDGISKLRLDDLPGGFTPLYLVLTAFIVVMVLSGNAWTRASKLALGLPLSARNMWSVRILSLIAIALLSAAALAITTGITVDLEQGTVAFNSVILLTAARAAVTSVLVLFLFQLPLSAQVSIPITAAYVVYVIFIGVITIVFSAAAVPSIVGTLVLLLITISLGAWLAVRLPPTFSIGPTVDEGSSPVWSTPDEFEHDDTVGWGTANGQKTGRSLHRVLFRGLKPNILIWLLLGIVTASVAVATLEFLGGTNAFMPLFFIVTYHLPLLQGALESMTPFDSLPIPRRTLWAHTIGQIAVAAALGLAIAISLFAINPKAYSQIHVSNCCVEIPWDYWELSRDGRIPTITTSWGESLTPQAHPLWRGRHAALYDPYESGAESSPRFVEYQMRRAADAVYGIPVPDSFSDPDYESPPEIADGAKREAFTLEETRGRLSGDRSRTAAVALMGLALLITGIMLPALLQYGPWTHRKIFKRASIGLIVLLVVSAVTVSVARLLGYTQVWYIGVLMSVGFRSFSHALPIPTSFLWILCVTFWFGAYLILGRVFGTIEFPREKTMNRFAEEY